MSKKNSSQEQGRKSFWHWFVSGEAKTPTDSPSADQPTAAAFSLSTKPKNESADQAKPDDHSPQAPQKAENKNDVAARAVQLAEEEIHKQRLAEAAAEEASRAEAASRRAEKEAALALAQTRAQRLQEESSAVQKAAAAALAELTAAEQAYAEAAQLAETAKAEEQALREQTEQELRELYAENETQLNASRAHLAQLAAEIKEHREAAENALKAAQEAESALEEAEAELRRINNEGAGELRQATKKVEDARAESDLAEKQMALCEAQLQNEQQNFNKVAAELAAIEESRRAAGQKVEQIREQLEQIKQSTAAEMESFQAVAAQKTGEIIAERDRIEQIMDENRAAADTARQNAAQAETVLHQTEEKLRLLALEREDSERLSKEKITSIIGRIDVAKNEVLRKKEQYLAAQKTVEQATMDLVKANALAKTARERADQALQEERDARTASEMALRLKSDATAAKGGEASSVLDKAELVLLSTIERASELLEEKTARRHQLEAEAARLQADSQQASANSAQATAAANDMIVAWLAAEENLVKIAAAVEYDKMQAEAAQAEMMKAYDRSINEAENKLAQMRREVAVALAEEEEATNTWKKNEAKRMDQEAKLVQLRAALEQERTELAERQQRQQNECEQILARAESEFALIDQEYDHLTAAHEQATQSFSEKLDDYNSEQQRLSALFAAKQEEIAAGEREAARLEIEYKQALSAAQQKAEQIEATLQSSRAIAAEEAERIRGLEQQQQEAEAELAVVQESIARTEAEARERAEQMIQPKLEARLAGEERMGNFGAKLAQKRQIAERAVKTAAEAFAERLTAVNNVAIRKVENEIAQIKESLLIGRKQADGEQAILREAEENYREMEAFAAALRHEEDEIRRGADEKYRRLEAELSAALAAAEQELLHCISEEERLTEDAAAAEQALQQANERRAVVEQALSEAEMRKQEVVEQTRQELAQLEAAYRAEQEQIGLGLPALKEAADRAELVAAQAQEAVAAAEAAYQQHMGELEQLLNFELNAPELMAARVDAIKARQQVILNKAKTRLSSLEEKEAELREAYKKSGDYAERSEQAKANVEGYLNKLQAEEAAERANAEAEIEAINARLTMLREDVQQKEQRFRETEKTLANSTELIDGAEKEHNNALIAAAKALAELQAAQAAKETATHLAQQASMAQGSVNSSTADIMKRAAEGLFSAAENATAVVEEKQALYRQAEEAVRQAESNMKSIRLAVGEAPAQMEHARAIWQAAESDFRRYKAEAEANIPAIRNRLDRFLADRRESLTAAMAAVTQCREEAATSAAGLERLSRQLMEISAEISVAAIELQTAEIAADDEIAAAEQQAEQELVEKRSLRVAAEEKAKALEKELQQLRAVWEAENETAVSRINAYKANEQQVQAEQKRLSDDYEQARDKALAAEREACELADAAAREMTSVLAEENAAAARHFEIKRQLKLSSELRVAKTAERDERRVAKERTLAAAEEERLRMLGGKTIARINADEKSAVAKSDFLAKRAKYEIAAQRVEELETALKQAKDKLEKICAESERALAVAQEKIAVFTITEG